MTLPAPSAPYDLPVDAMAKVSSCRFRPRIVTSCTARNETFLARGHNPLTY
jgi:hypothetical protein